MNDTARPNRSGPFRRLSPQRIRVLIWTSIGIVALAGVIFAVSALSSPRESVPPLPEVKIAGAEQSRKDYSDALAALKSNDTTVAKQLLEKAVAEDRNNTEAAKKLVELKSTPLPKGKDKPKTNPPAAADDPWEEPVGDVRILLPTRVTGFAVGAAIVEGPDGELTLDPDTAALAGRVSRVQLSVHDRGSRQAAQTYVTQHRDTLYALSKGTPDLNGVAGKSGNDKGHLAAVIFSRGRFAFEVVVTAKGDPSQVIDVAVAVAKEFPAHP